MKDRLRGAEAIGRTTAMSPLNFSEEVRADMILPPKVKIVDMSLKEGLQMEGVALSLEESLRVARELEELGVDTIKVAYRLGRAEDLELMNALTRMKIKAEIIVQVSNHQHPPLYSNERKLESIDRLVDMGYTPFLTTALSDTLLKGFANFRGEGSLELADLKKKEIERSVEHTERAKRRGGKIIGNLQDGLRADLLFLGDVCRALADAGMDCMVFDDIAMPGIPAVFKYVTRRAVEAAPHGTYGTYVHDDYGFGLGAALASLEGGASVHFCSINGYGKRSGMVDLAHLAVVLELMYGYDTGINLQALNKVCNLFADIYRRPIPRVRPIYGTSAFTHGADWHVQWAANPDSPMLDDYPWVVQSMKPELVGREGKVTLYAGSGEMAIRVKAADLGVTLSIEQAETVRPLLRDEMVIRKRPLEDAEFLDIVRRAVQQD